MTLTSLTDAAYAPLQPESDWSAHGGNPSTVFSGAAGGAGELVANQPAVVLPFDASVGISPARRQQLDDKARSLIATHSDRNVTVTDGFPTGNLRQLPQLNYTDMGHIATAIGNDRSLGEQEKAYVWNQIADHKFTQGFDDPSKWYTVSNDGARPEVLDTHRPSTSANHAFVSFNDGYHAPLAMLPEDQAAEKIREHENAEGFGLVTPILGFNDGDFNASVGIVSAMRDYRTGGFAAFAEEWSRRFVQP
jgi:hypothetical protein